MFLIAIASFRAAATELSFFASYTNVDYVSAGVGGLRETGYGDISLTGVSGTIKKAYLYWHGHGKQGDYDASITNALVFINGNPAQGQVIGTSGPNGWNFPPYNFYFGQAFRADVTDLITGNGTYTVSDFDPLPFTIQGASLIVIFDDGITTNNRDITLYNG
ncbi:MAG: hypothetical protein JWN25_2920, partial [Verrucomicrobiales bacterium]|nr:hypothetical protein [Verrucomicrobiales bacterium]